MGLGALSCLLLLLLLVVSGDASDMKGHFDPGEEAAPWVPKGCTLGTRGLWALTCCTPFLHQPSAAMPWACRTGPSQTATSLFPVPGQTPLLPATAGTYLAQVGLPEGMLLPVLSAPLPKTGGFWEGSCH